MIFSPLPYCNSIIKFHYHFGYEVGGCKELMRSTNIEIENQMIMNMGVKRIRGLISAISGRRG